MSESVLSVERLGKRYRICHERDNPRYTALRDVIAETAKSLPRLISTAVRASRPGATKVPTTEDFWALTDVSFGVRQGEAIGIIGRNGAGKSTLLKILSRITEPTEGLVRIRGRVASLLEVGTGFHPELTGRENIFLNGAILGMTKAEIKAKFDEIVAFAEVATFLDTPVKRYSSGMYVRLAFAVAAHLEPEILIVDEVLAVGDAQFQAKCLGKMGEVTARQGRTVLFVSHNMIAVQSLCQRCICLDHGKVQFDGPTRQSIGAYLKQTVEIGSEHLWTDPCSAPGNSVLRIRRIAVAADSPSLNPCITMETPINIETEYWARKSGTVVEITYHLINEHGVIVLSTGSGSRAHEPGLYVATCQIPGGLLNSGSYSLKLFIVENNSHSTYRKEGMASFQVVESRAREAGFMEREPGVVQPRLHWRTERTDLHPKCVVGDRLEMA